MGALGHAGFPAPSAGAHALAAGADLLLFNRDHVLHQAAIREIATQIRAGKIPLARLDEAVRRVLRAKARFGLLAPPPANPAKAAAICAAPAHRALAAECAAASVTLLRNEAHLLPLARGVTPVVITVPSAAKLGALLNTEPVRVAEQPSERDLAAALQAVRAHPGAPVIITLAGARANPGQRDLAKKILATGAPVILVAVREPYDLMEFAGGTAGGPALLATYGANPVALTALAAVLRGEAKPAGHLPVELPNLYALGTGLENLR